MARVVLLTYHDGKRYVLATFTKPYKLVIRGFAPPYASHGSYPFEVNIDMRYLYRKLEGVNPQRILDKMEESLKESIITDEKVEKRFREIEEAKAQEQRFSQIRELIEGGMTYIEVQNKLGVSSKTIRKVLRDMGKQGKHMESIEDADDDSEN